MDIAVLAGSVSTALFVGSYLPMLLKAFRTRDLDSYSRGNLVLATIGNALVLHLCVQPATRPDLVPALVLRDHHPAHAGLARAARRSQLPMQPAAARGRGRARRRPPQGCMSNRPPTV